MSFGKLRSQGHATSLSNNGLPGPGSYNPPLRQKRTAQAGMGHRPPPKVKDNTPGPSDYSISLGQNRGGNANMGYGPNHVGPTATISPSPADYETCGAPKRAPLPARDFGNGRNDPEGFLGAKINTAPGPCEYNAEKVKGHRRAANACSKRSELFKPKDSPGPGAYTTIGPPAPDPTCIAFPKSVNHKGPTIGSEGPGPGQYTPAGEKRSPLPASDFGIPHASVTPMQDYKATVEGPGPGEYNEDRAKDLRFAKKSVGMAVATRRQLFAVAEHPGPAAYDTRGEVLEKKPASASPSFGNTVNHIGPRVVSGPDQPGPSTYLSGSRLDACDGSSGVGVVGLGSL